MTTTPLPVRDIDGLVPLTTPQLDQVGGGLSLPVVVGCLSCTSGGNLGIFDRFREVINPVDTGLVRVAGSAPASFG